MTSSVWRPRRPLPLTFWLLCLLGLTALHGAFAQIPGLPSLPTGLPGAPPATPKTPSARVALNGSRVFDIYAATQNAAQDRADLVSLRLAQALQKTEPTDPPPPVTTQVVGGETVILLADRAVLTVTQEDAAANGETTVQLAADWTTTMEKALTEAQRERRPGYWREAALEAGGIVLAAALLTLAIWLVAHRLLDKPGWSLLALVWLVAAFLITNLFPQTRPLHRLLGHGIIRPVGILLIMGLLAAGASRLLTLFLRHIFPPMPDDLSAEERTERTYRRRATLGAVARITGVSLLWIIASVVSLSWIGVNLSALLASAGLIGVALGLAAQDTMKDLVAGINILLDDRFGVGDNIAVGSFSGTVENLNLRVTQIRDSSGRLITFPNRSIEAVANATQRWAQVDFKAGVSYDASLRDSMEVMEAAATQLATDWPERVLSPPKMLGVDAYNPTDITLRLLMRTVPGDQWAVERELRLRVKEAFDKNGISMSTTQRTVTVLENAPGENPAVPQDEGGAA